MSEEQQKTLVININWWLGRVVAMSGAITEVAKKRPVKVVTSRPLVFWGNPFIKSVHGLDDRRLFEDVIKWNDYIEIEPYTNPKFFNDWVNWLNIVQEELELDKVAEPIMYLAEHEKLNNLLPAPNPILFQPFGSTMEMNWADKSYRSIPVEQAQYLADGLVKMWFTPYLVVKPGSQPMLNNCQILDTPDMRFVVTLTARYPVVWCDSSLHHCAKAFWKKALVVWAWTDKERYWYKSHVNMREYPMVAHTPLRLSMNDFNFDISNQNTNKFTTKFLDNVLGQVHLITN